MGKAFGAVAGVGAVASLYAMKKTWDPLPSVKAAGFTTLDMSVYEGNKLVTEKWRGKPIFVLKQTPDMVEFAKKKNELNRLIKVGNDYYMVVIGLCTHLGCIPGYNPDKRGFLCACHGGQYDSTAMVTKAPPPRGLDIPPFKVDGNKLVLGEEGPEYKKLLADGVTMAV
ncbi:Ubiquinol-cytochrome C reductase iron-sulfur subunit [hydrothermal vent metagenome]|uniref:Ubiquinol-cytochrome C reductase iron-sulfur subunit n=1 Tax=hydrothermal vent metagenome TaxID=652676 RepID=A0A1W1BHZ2_9ZZZZ